MSFNINRANKDPFYRYKMPAITAKTEGKGNGIKTNVTNLLDVSRAINRPNEHVLKFFGFELGAQTKLDYKTDKFLVNGVHDPAKLQNVLDIYIKKYVLCDSCMNPETTFQFYGKANSKKVGEIMKDCKACGKLTPVTMGDKLSAYIWKNQDEYLNLLASNNTTDNDDSKGKHRRAAATASENIQGGGVSISDLAKQQQANQEAEQEEEEGIVADEKLQKDLEDLEEDSDLEFANNDDWALDLSEDAVQKRQLLAQSQPLSANLQILHRLGEWIESEDPSDVEIYKKIISLNLLADAKIMSVIIQALVESEEVASLTEFMTSFIEEHKAILIKLINERESFEVQLLGGLERLVAGKFYEEKQLLPKAIIQLYNLDIVSEETILSFYTKCSGRFIEKKKSKELRRLAKPVIEWLQQAEEDSDEE
ncbi:hypothetical protein FOG48_00792 [Hanseniaspora uvarum]|nr:hypothetical protein FOG48_00792 [Hanseniaspora uvarum]